MTQRLVDHGDGLGVETDCPDCDHGYTGDDERCTTCWGEGTRWEPAPETAAVWEAAHEAELQRQQVVHRRHRLWAHRRIVKWLARTAYSLGVISSYACTMNSSCRMCLSNVQWRGRRPYLLGKHREWWFCLLRCHHLRTVGWDHGLCTKCCPCPDCGSTAQHHDYPCRSAA